MIDNKPTSRERVQEITAGIEQGIKELFESEKYMRYLLSLIHILTPEQLNAMLSGGTVPGMAAASANYNEQEDTDHEE